MLNDLVIGKLEDVDGWKHDGAPGGRPSHELPLMGAGDHNAGSSAIAVDQHVLHRMLHVRKGGNELAEERSGGRGIHFRHAVKMQDVVLSEYDLQFVEPPGVNGGKILADQFRSVVR